MRKRQKQGQISIGFHWIYILIAGVIILLFFVGVVVRQKAVSEERISATVVQKLDGIFTGAGLSEQTTQVVEVPEMEISFTCDEEGYSDYSIGRVNRETPFQPIFSAKGIESSRLLTWTLEWMMPFKVANYLFITAPNIRYYLVYDSNNLASKSWAQEAFLSLPEKLQEEMSIEELAVDGYANLLNKNDDKVRFVFFGDVFEGDVPSALRGMADQDVTAVWFTGSIEKGVVAFYRKQGEVWNDGNSTIVMGSYSTDNPNFYAAIFAEDKTQYECNLRKAFRRLEILGEVYLERALDLQYLPSCTIRPVNFNDLITRARQCSREISQECDLDFAASEILKDNQNLKTKNCGFLIY